jgi:hypothetical protein
MPLPTGKGIPPVITDGSQSPGQDPVVALDKVKYVKDTFITRTAIDPKTYAEEYGNLLGYIKGSYVIVTYYNNDTVSDLKSQTIDQTTISNTIHESYTKINKMELIFSEQLQFSYDKDRNVSIISGVALVYPGIVPIKGDLFIMTLNDGKSGIMHIGSVERIGYRQGAFHKVTFTQRYYAEDDSFAKIEASVSNTVNFVKSTFLGDSTTLLKTDQFNQLKRLEAIKDTIIKYYYTRYFRSDIGSIMHPSPENYYDPYLVNFLTSRISIRQSINRAKQLYPSLPYYEFSIWDMFNDKFNTDVTILMNNFSFYQLTPTYFDANITSLINQKFIILSNPNDIQTPLTGSIDGDELIGYSMYKNSTKISEDSYYIFSKAFYDAEIDKMNDLEKLVYDTITNKSVTDITSFLDIVTVYNKLSLSDGFYTIPIYMWLIDMAIATLTIKD